MDKNTSIGAIAGVGIVLVIAFVFALFPAESDDTIILVNKQGTDPVNSCAPGNGLILAQNLTDLCDVVIVSPITGEVLKYNGTFWINQNETISGVTSVTSNSNSTIGVVPTSGNVVLYPEYELLCHAEGTGSNITCGTFEAKTFLSVSIIVNVNSTGTGLVEGFRFNNDNGTNYSIRTSANTGADNTLVNIQQCQPRFSTTTGVNEGGILSFDIMNLSTENKLMQGTRPTGLSTGAGTAPGHTEWSCKWANTSSQITSISLIVVSGTSSYTTGTQITVWGYN